MRMLNKPSLIARLVGFVLATGLANLSAEQLSSRPADEWVERLDRPERVEGMKVDEVIARLRLNPGDVVADLGAGTGVFSVPFGKAVTPGGKVYAVDIDEGFFDHIDSKARAANVTNVDTVLGQFSDPNLPDQDVDVAFFHDVLHHIEDRAGYLKNLARYVKASGRVAIIDLDPEGGPHRDQPELQVSQDEVTMWMADAGFRLAEEYYLFDGGKWFVVYSRP